MQGHNGGILYHDPKTGHIVEAVSVEMLRDMKRHGFVKTTPKNFRKRKANRNG